MKFFSICDLCGIKKFFINKREIKLPIGALAISKKLMCGTCYSDIKKLIK